MFLKSIPGLHKEVQQTLYYQNKLKKTDKLLLIDKCNIVINSIVEGNRNNWYVEDYGEVPLNSTILREQLGKSEYINILALLINLNYITADNSYISNAMATVENKKRISKGITAPIRPVSKKYGLTSKGKSKGIEKVGVLLKRTEIKQKKYRLNKFNKYYNIPFHKNIMDNIFNLHFNHKKALPILQKVRLSGQVEKIEYYENIYATLIEMNAYKTKEEYFLTNGFYYTISKVVNRLYYFFATVPSEFRECLNHKEGKTLAESDLSNAQPLFLALKFNKIEPHFLSKVGSKSFYDNTNNRDKKDKDSICSPLANLKKEKKVLLNDVLNGNFYKNIANYSISIGDKKFYDIYVNDYGKFKQKVLGNGLYGKLRAKKNVLKEEKYLMALYPNFMNWIRETKINEGYKAIPIMAQQIESSIFVNEFFNKVDFFAVPIHDSIITTKDKSGQIVKILTDIILKEFPFLKEEQTKNLFKTKVYE